MNKTFRLVVVLSIVFLNAALIFGQEKTLERSVYESIVNKANEKLEGKTYRTVSTYETFTDRNAAPVRTVKTVTERVPPGRFREIMESNDQKIETIRIGTKIYRRENDGEWKIEAGSGAGAGMGCGAANVFESYKVVENSNLDGKSVNLYEMTKKLDDVNCGSQGKTQVWIDRYWISNNGLLLKTESINEDVEKKSLSRNVTIYEYDPKIKIEAPIK